MKKEKQVRSYKRRTKSGKIITVKAHTAKYEAADEKAKKSSKKEGAGKELEERKKKPVQLEIPFGKEEEKKTTKKVRPVGSGTVGPEPKKKKSTTSSNDNDKAVINFMESTYRVHHNPKTGKFDYALTGKQTKTRSVTMEKARKSFQEHQDYLNKIRGKKTKTPGERESLAKAKKGGYLPSKSSGQKDSH